MKINKNIYLLIVSLFVLTSCEPIVDELELQNNTTVENVELIALQTTNGGNEITLDMNTPGVTGHWDYMIGKGLTDRVTVVFPVTGTFDFKFVGSLGAEFFEKTTQVEITNLDTPVAPEWSALLGDDAVAGKTWVFDGVGGDNGLWWFMSAPDAWDGLWWNAGGECCPPVDVNGKMHFDLNGAANFTYFADATNGETELGSFVLDTNNMTLNVYDTNVLGSSNPDEGGYNPSGMYQLISLTEDEMVLFIPNAIWDSGWTWVFRPE